MTRLQRVVLLAVGTGFPLFAQQTYTAQPYRLLILIDVSLSIRNSAKVARQVLDLAYQNGKHPTDSAKDNLPEIYLFADRAMKFSIGAMDDHEDALRFLNHWRETAAPVHTTGERCEFGREYGFTVSREHGEISQTQLNLERTSFDSVFRVIKDFVERRDEARSIVWIVSDGEESSPSQCSELPRLSVDKDFDLTLIHPSSSGPGFRSRTTQAWIRVADENGRAHLGFEDSNGLDREQHLAHELRGRQLQQGALMVGSSECAFHGDSSPEMRVEAWVKTDADVDWEAGDPGGRLGTVRPIGAPMVQGRERKYAFEIPGQFLPVLAIRGAVRSGAPLHPKPWIEVRIPCNRPGSRKVMLIKKMHAVSWFGSFSATLQPVYQEGRAYTDKFHLPAKLIDIQGSGGLKCDYSERAATAWAKGEPGDIECKLLTSQPLSWRSVELKFRSGTEELPFRSELEIALSGIDSAIQPLQFLMLGTPGLIVCVFLAAYCFCCLVPTGRVTGSLVGTVDFMAVAVPVVFAVIARLVALIPGIMSYQTAADEDLTAKIGWTLLALTLILWGASKQRRERKKVLRLILELEAIAIGGYLAEFLIPRKLQASPTGEVVCVALVAWIMAWKTLEYLKRHAQPGGSVAGPSSPDRGKSTHA